MSNWLDFIEKLKTENDGFIDVLKKHAPKRKFILEVIHKRVSKGVNHDDMGVSEKTLYDFESGNPILTMDDMFEVINSLDLELSIIDKKPKQYLLDKLKQAKMNDTDMFKIYRSGILENIDSIDHILIHKRDLLLFESVIKTLKLSLKLSQNITSNVYYYEDGKRVKYSDQNMIKKYFYDDNDKLIRYEDSKGFWYTRKRDSKGRELRYDDSKGDWIDYKYDNDGNITSTTTYHGSIKIREYDNNGNIIFLNSNHFVIEYDDKGIGSYVNTACDDWVRYGYDGKGNNINCTYSSGWFESWEYDDNNNKVKYSDSFGYWEKYEYVNDRLVKKSQINGDWEKYEYDVDGNKIKQENCEGSFFKYEYENNKLIGVYLNKDIEKFEYEICENLDENSTITIKNVERSYYE